MVDECMVVCIDNKGSSHPSPANNNDGNEKEKMQEKQFIHGSKGGIFNGSFQVKSVSRKSYLRECRICQEEEEDEKRMESPCACSGTLKFAHRKCIQRWCNKKGDITCEICSQIFSPDYTSPPPRNNAGVTAIHIRQAWEEHHVDLGDPGFLAFTESQRRFLESEYDEYATASNGTLACFRSIAITLMLLLLMRQSLMLSKDLGMFQESSAFFRYQISFLQLAGFLLPCYAVSRSLYIAQCRRRNQG